MSAPEIPISYRTTLLVFIEDINQRKLSEQATKESEARYKQAMQIADLGSWSYELLGKSFRGDEGCSRIFSRLGIRKPYSISSIAAILDDEHRELFEKALEHLCAGYFQESNLHEFYKSFDIQVGTDRIYLNVGMNFEYNDKSELFAVRGIIQDITGLKRAEEALKKSTEEIARQKEILAGMIENMPIGVVAKNVKEGNKYILCNLEAERILNIEANKIIGADENFILEQKEAELVKRQDLKVITSRRVVDFGEMTMKVGSQYKEIKKVKIPVFDTENEVQLIFTLMEDVTDERSLERQLQHSQKMDAVGRLAGGIAHDFNNMLQAIMGYGNLILESLDRDEENYENSFMILKAAEQARGLVKQLMAFSRKEELVTRSVNLGNLVEDLVKMLARLIGEHIEVETRVQLNDISVMADPGQLEQALVNLCLNARDAMPGGGKLTISAGVTRLELEDCSIHADATPGEFALISVQDSGNGIPKEFLEHIFEPFFTTKDLGKGTGLGLATVYAIVNRHDGFLKVDSEEGIGTVFSIYIPLSESNLNISKFEEGQTTVKGGSETVLLAEDEPMVRNFASRILQRAGYKVVEAVDGEEAINLFVSNGGEIDMLVFDVMMPRKNGRDAYNEIEKLHKDIPVLFCSGYGDDLLKTEYNVDVGGRILPKPYKSRELLREVRLILDRMGSNSIKPQL